MIVSIYLLVLTLQAAPLAPPALDICGDELALQVVMFLPAGAWPGLDEKEDRGRAKNKLDEFHVM